MRIACIVGARPNFMKMAPILRAMESYPEFEPVLIHTGQHYDNNLSQVFFQELEIPKPEICLGVGSGSHAQQTADVLVAVESVLVEARNNGRPFERMIVVGDVNSTLAATLAATKLHIPVAHVEAGLRSGDRRMPEEINRIMTDAICDMLLVSEDEGVDNLKQEGRPAEQIHLVGNVMIDTLRTHLPRAIESGMLESVNVEPGGYCLTTLHRPSNVDDAQVLGGLVNVLIDIAKKLPVVFPVHPRTNSRLENFGLMSKLRLAENVKLVPPRGYLDFLCLSSQAKVIVTDSGGLQEESTVLGVPCLTMRNSTERPVTVEQGTSTLIGNCPETLDDYLNRVLNGDYKTGVCPELWDGRAAHRIVELIVQQHEAIHNGFEFEPRGESKLPGVANL